MDLSEIRDGLSEMNAKTISAILWAMGAKGTINSLVISHQHAGKFPAFIFSKNSKINIDCNADIEIGSLFVFGMKLKRRTNHWLAPSTLYLSEDATFCISEGGTGTHIGSGSWLNIKGDFQMGSTSYINAHAHVSCDHRISIGEGCAIAREFRIRDHDAHELRIDGVRSNDPEPVEIEDHVWIGNNVEIKKGVTVGHGSIVASNSVVTRDVPPKTLVAGVPAEILETDVSWD